MKKRIIAAIMTMVMTLGLAACGTKSAGDSDIDYIKEKLEFNEPDEKICGEVIERITIFYGRQFEIKLKNVPLTFRLSYTATGRGKNYKLEFKVISGV